MLATMMPPLIVNTSLGFLLFTSHSFFSLSLAKLPFFQQGETGGIIRKVDHGEEEITLESLLRGPTIVPRHPTLLSALSGAGAGIVQGFAFTPVENVVRSVTRQRDIHTSISDVKQAARSISKCDIVGGHQPRPATRANTSQRPDARRCPGREKLLVQRDMA